jgi:hypothetical protein
MSKSGVIEVMMYVIDSKLLNLKMNKNKSRNEIKDELNVDSSNIN